MIQLAVWGNSGAGKTLVSCALAHHITTHGKNVIVINTDCVAPALPIYLPLMDELPEHSLGGLLSGPIKEERLRNRVHIHPQNNHLGFMALAESENELTFQSDWQTETVRQLVHLLTERQMTDVIIFDCTSDVLNDAATLHALEKSVVVFQVTSPDVRGITFLKSQMPILRGGAFSQNHVGILNNAFEYSPTQQLQKDYEIPYMLPHSRGAYSKFCGGELIKGLNDAAGVSFMKTIKQIYQKVVKPLEQ